MPVCTINLLRLCVRLDAYLDSLAQHLHTDSERPLVVSKPIRWIITPTKFDAAELITGQSPPWDLLLILPGTTGLPGPLRAPELVKSLFTLQVGVPKSIVNGFKDRNDRLLWPKPGDVPQLTGALDRPRIASSAQNLEFTDELKIWMKTWDPEGEHAPGSKGKGAVSMLNLLAFKEGMHEEYLKYGKAFAEGIGSKRGGNAKVVGRVVADSGGSKSRWDEVALAHYPSIYHFSDMSASEDYQAVNQKHRIGSLDDTCILMTSELEIPGNALERARL